MDEIAEPSWGLIILALVGVHGLLLAELEEEVFFFFVTVIGGIGEEAIHLVFGIDSHTLHYWVAYDLGIDGDESPCPAVVATFSDFDMESVC